MYPPSSRQKKIEEINDNTVEAFEKTKENEDVAGYIEEVIKNFSEKGNEILETPDNYLTGGHLYYEKLASLLDEKIQKINGSIAKVEKELFEGTNQKTLTGLLERLESITKKKKAIGEFVTKIGPSSTVSLVKQVLETANKIQQQKMEKYNHLLLQHIYSVLALFLQKQQDNLATAIYRYNKIISKIDRETERVIRIGRSAFTYNKSKFDELTKHLMNKMYADLEVISTRQVLDKLGSPVPEKYSYDEEFIERLLGIIQPDLLRLTSMVDSIFCKDHKVYDYLKTTLAQFFMTLKLDRDRFPAMETSKCKFVMCTKKFYDKFKDDLFEGYSHIETDNPFNVVVTKHEEGFPFIAMSYINRINKEYKEQHAHGTISQGHIKASLEEKLPLLDT
jgi:hypothetical protein